MRQVRSRLEEDIGAGEGERCAAEARLQRIDRARRRGGTTSTNRPSAAGAAAKGGVGRAETGVGERGVDGR